MVAAWGVTAGVVALFAGERIPLLRQDVFCKIPIIGDIWSEYRKKEEDEALEQA